MQYTDLVFDLYGTLVDIHTDENDTVWEKTALFFGYHGAAYTGATLKAAFEAELAQHEAKAGQAYECYPDIPIERVMAQLFRRARLGEQAETLAKQAALVYRIAATDYIRLYPHVLEALDALLTRGYRLWLLSNAQAVFTRHELAHLGLTYQFDKVYLSSDYECRKPDPRFFQALLNGGERPLDPAHCLMIGNDRKTDIAGAQASGMATLYMHTGLTPSDQAPADPALRPGTAPAGCRHMEFEGDDWLALLPLLLTL